MGAKKFWLLLSIILVVLGLSTLAVMLRKSSVNQPLVSSVKPELEIEADELDGITVFIPGSEKSSYWELKFSKCVYHNDIGHLKNIKGEFYNAERALYRISAQTGDLYWKTSILKLKGNVKFEAGTKELDADELIWNPGAGTRVITARTHVIFRTPDLTVNATQVSTDPDFKKIIFSGATKASFQ